MAKKLVNMMLAAALVLTHAGAPAEDIDLFVGGNPPDPNSLPNVLIIVDNTANWGSGANPQPFTNEKAALVSTFNALPTGDGGVAKFRVGIMFAAETGAPNNNISGGYVRAAVRPMTAANKTIYSAFLNNIDSNADKGNGGESSLVMAEAHRYLTGGVPVAGNNKAKADYAGNVYAGTTAQSRAVWALPGNALNSVSGSPYNAPPPTGNCGKTFIIYLSNGPAQDNTTVINASKAMLTAAGGSTTEIPLSPADSQGNVIDEWARFLNGNMGVVTYTIDINPGTTGQGPGWTALLRSAANVGKGKYFAVNSATGGGDKIAEALLSIFGEIQSENSAFASASLPVSVNTQGTYLNQVFIGMFRPDSTPRWFGNLKQYQFRADVDALGNIVSLQLADKNNEPVINPLNGFISPCARSFWSTADTYWPNDYFGACPATDLRSNSPDGEIVEKGAAAQRLRTQLAALVSVGDRTVYTCSACGDGSTLQSFNTSTASIAALGVASAAEQGTLINWVRGANNAAGEPVTNPAAIRASVHGDVVHARPLAIDYGGTTGVVVFYGGNDGMLRAIGGNKPDASGNELWAFIAPEHYDRLKRLRNNTPLVSFPNAPPGATAKDYFFDGPIGTYRSGSTVWIYPTMRRGGSHVYAFNVSDPAAPSLKWKRGPAELPNVGQAWSEPKVVKVAGYPLASATKSPVILMGGGYDACEDQDAAPVTACTSPKGNRVYVIDANSGTVLKSLGAGGADGDAILRSVAADVTPVDSDYDGYVDVAYAVDTAANIYRIDIGSNAPANWTVKRIASLGCTTSAECARKFLHAPEVVVGAGYNAVLVGSGNRERPLLSNAAAQVDNGFFMVKDDRTAAQPLIETADLLEVNPDVPLDADQQAALAAPTNKGWFVKFGTGVCTTEVTANCHDKEQVVTSAVVVAGVAYFSTHTPTEASQCGANLGLARGYAVNFMDASAANGDSLYSTFAGGGLPPSPVAGVVSVALTGADGTPVTNPDGTPATANVPFVIGGGGVSGIDPTLVEVNPSGVRGRVYWYIQQ